MLNAQRRFLLPGFLILAVAVALLAITNESFWIDELMSAWLATSDSFENYKERHAMLNTSDIQMPLYMLYLWSWQTCFGGTELVLRLANVPWLLFGIYALWRYLRNTPRVRLFAVGLVLISPFVWYYLNEARPYAMQLGGSCAVLGCGMRMLIGWRKGTALGTGDLVVAAIGIVAMAGSSLLSIPWIGTFLALFVFGVLRKSVTFGKRALIATASIVAVLLVPLAIHYGVTLMEGARAAMLKGSLIQGLAFSVYEILGFSGLGPGRTELRQEGIGVFTMPQIVLVVLLAVVQVAIGILFLRKTLRSKPAGDELAGWIILLAPPLVFMVLLGLLMDFRVLGRHLTPLIPVVVAYLAASVTGTRSKVPAIALVVALAGLFAASCLSLRFAERHRKDDYRQAAAIARAEVAKGRGVLWIANTSALPYYDLFDLGVHGFRASPRDPNSPQLRDLYYIGKPDPVFGLRPSYVIMSKPDIHDPTSFGRNFILDNGYTLERTFPGFTLWSRR